MNGNGRRLEMVLVSLVVGTICLSSLVSVLPRILPTIVILLLAVSSMAIVLRLIWRFTSRY